jgi:hypothetical protein
MTRNQYLRVQQNKARAKAAEDKSNARETMRTLKVINPDWSYDKCLAAAYIANGSSNLPISKYKFQ